MTTVVAVGAQWGDEGKGKIVDWLGKASDLVVRFHGGNNAGHTLVVDGETTVLHIVPSGVLNSETVNVIGPGVVVDPGALLKELDALSEKGVLKDPSRVRLSGRAHVILEWHKALDIAREKARGKGAIGTTGRGIGPTYEDKVARRGVRIADLLDEKALREIIAKVGEQKNFELVEYLKGEPVDIEAVADQALAWGKLLAPYVEHTGPVLDSALRQGKNILFEGAQGTFLDIDHGTYPFVTSSNCVAGAVCTGAGVGPTKIDRVLGITKAYTTRVGSGPFPTEDFGKAGQYLGEKGHEFGATTGRQRRCGWLDALMLRESVAVNGFTGLAVNKLDVMSGLGDVKIATSYEIDGKEVKTFPMTLGEIERAKPVYETLPGWDEDLTRVRKFEDLPENARNYIDRVEELAETPVDVISIGPGRDETIVRNNPFRPME